MNLGVDCRPMTPNSKTF